MALIQMTSYFKVTNRIITISSAKKLANELLKIHNQTRRSRQSKRLSFTVTFDDKSEYQSSRPNIFDDNMIMIPRRVHSIDMVLIINEDTQIKINLTHDSSVETNNQLTVRGSDSTWVNGILRKMEELFESFDPQSTYIQRFKWPIHVLFSVSIGSIISSLIVIGINLFSESPLMNTPMGHIVVPQTFSDYVIKYLACTAIGFLPAFFVMEKLRALWPVIEIQIGPEHKLIEKRRKHQITQFLLVGIIPITLQLLYDIVVSNNGL